MSKYIIINGDIINLDNIACIENRAFGGYLIHFAGGDKLRLEFEDYKKLKNILECVTL